MSVINKWQHSDNKYICNKIRIFLHTNETSKLQIYYIDAINSFPIDELLSLQLTQEQISRINVIVSLELKELLNTLNQIIDKFNDSVNKNCQEKTNPKESNDKIYIILNGLETIFDNSLIQDASNAYSLLNKILLSLRLMSCEHKENWFNYMIIPRKVDDGHNSNNFKRRKLRNDLSIWEYIITYYL